MASADKCPKCGKTVYATEKMMGAGKAWHKACFRCHGDGCTITLTLATVQAKDGKIYCKAHVPKHQAKQVADTVAMKTALNAPKKVTESTGNVQKGDQIKLKAVNAAAPKPITGTAHAAPAKPAAPAAETPAEAPAAEAPPAEAPAAEAPAAEAPAAEAPAAEAPAAEAPAAEAPAAEAPAAEAPAAEAPAAEAPAAEAPAAEAPPADAPAEAPPAEAPPADAPAEAPPADG